MDFNEVLKNRRSIRDFTDKEVSDEIIFEIMNEAMQTASWVNSQPWKVYVIKNDIVKEAVRMHNFSYKNKEPMTSDYPHPRRQDWPKYASNHMTNANNYMKKMNVNMEEFTRVNYNFFNSSSIAILCVGKNSPIWSILDLGAFSSTLMLAAKNKGVDSCHAYEIIKFADNIRKLAKIPEEFSIVTAVALGYASDHELNSFVSNRENVKDICEIVK
ncbi:F420 biosynthesis protein FbiB, C-terminal domain [Mycoplasmopsis maculosa]|uniref:F420 biosynthesis protein FbiB, C-terminal domain n=1 Tax=Mycoplasmopsis maculosa TaxID=114885 RepID=A0A449B4I2_9BACT|nr:nitroreductase [Mycoplasmopsis maculosa]VEU75514.1 F420 biosynthesis protein FbiB, C-terminal domain [Mycoplasmopsis maculosa]